MAPLWFLIGFLLGVLPVAVVYELIVRRRLTAAREAALADAAAMRQLQNTRDRLTIDLRAEAADMQARLHETLLRLEQESSTRREIELQLSRTLDAVDIVREEHEAAHEALTRELAQRTRQAIGVVRRLEHELAAARAGAARQAAELARLRTELDDIGTDRDAQALQLSDLIGGSASMEAHAEAAVAERQSMQAQLAVAEDQIALLEEQLVAVEELIGLFPIQQMEIRRLAQALDQAAAREARITRRLDEAAGVARRIEARYREALRHLRRLLVSRETMPKAGGNGAHPAPAPVVDPVAELRRVHGIGPTYAQRLVGAGILSLAQLAAVSPETLAGTAGLSPQQAARATAWIDEARRLAPAISDSAAQPEIRGNAG